MKKHWKRLGVPVLLLWLLGKTAYRSPSPKLMDKAWSIWLMELSSSFPVRSLSRRLSMVRICSSRTMESRVSPQLSAFSSICVGNLFFSRLLVIAAAITVGQRLNRVSGARPKKLPLGR